MPSVDKNLEAWKLYDWQASGNEWSQAWGGTDAHWHGTILPRIRHWLPCDTILEIAPGFGRWTQYLKNYCRHLIVVDLSQNCIEACQKRFFGDPNISYFVNDGRSLEMVAEGSIDFAFTFDSLVHADADVIQGYLRELALKLTPEGVAFIHHSNMGSYHRRLRVGAFIRRVGELHWRLNKPVQAVVERFDLINKHWRSIDTTAELVAAMCAQAGLYCLVQECVAWGTRGILNDCLSVLTRIDSKRIMSTRRYQNKGFMKEALHVRRISQLYGKRSG
jgi:ubiquinone/menaquinone biosynthesis C-methylase UbiE